MDLLATLDDHFQEAGRAGRDEGQSEAILVIYPKCLNSKHIAKSVKEYAKNKLPADQNCYFLVLIHQVTNL